MLSEVKDLFDDGGRDDHSDRDENPRFFDPQLRARTPTSRVERGLVTIYSACTAAGEEIGRNK